MKKKVFNFLNKKNIYSLDIFCPNYLIKKAINCSECKMVPDVLIYEYQTSKFRISCSSCSKCTSSAKTINRAIK